MSIIIRLQNLPWSARSGDIRHFFAGLRIPDGGVHIIGGDKGDAFIAFNTDEDARLAMRKDGGKIKDTRVKLLLSSHMEMQHVIERITKQPFPKPASPRPSSKERERSPRPRSNKGRSPDPKSQRGRSPIRRQRDSSPRSSSGRNLHRSRDGSSHGHGRRRSRSPIRRSRSPLRKSRSPGRQSSSPAMKATDSTFLSTYATDVMKDERDVRVVLPQKDHLDSQQDWKNEPYGHNLQDGSFNVLDMYDRRSPHSKPPYFNKNIEVGVAQHMPENYPPINNSIPFLNEGPNFHPNRERDFANSNTSNAFSSNQFSYNEPSYNMQDPKLQYPPRPDFQSKINEDGREMFHENTSQPNKLPSFQQNQTFNNYYDQSGNFSNSEQSRQPSLMLPPPPPFMFPSMLGERREDGMNIVHKTGPSSESFCVRLDGFSYRANFRDIQAALKGIFAPFNNIQWEVDNQNRRTGAALVKLSNKEDFINVLEGGPHFLDDRKIEITPCPDHIFHEYFPSEERGKSFESRYRKEFCYVLKGLPFQVTYNDVVKFFRGLRIADLFIIYEENGKASGSGYVEFFDEKDYDSAMEMNGKKIAHRYIELLPSSKSDMKNAKVKYGDKNQPTDTSFSNFQASQQKPQKELLNRRKLCALLTGLPPTIHFSEIFNFFEDSAIKPFAVHIMMNDKRQPNGKSFAEFLNPLDFEVALKCHGKYIENNMICVRQVLQDEMVKILDSQDASHHFGSDNFEKSSVKSQTNLPEKVPYLWEPPDANECDLSLEGKKEKFVDKFDNFNKTSYNEKARSTERNFSNFRQSDSFGFARSNAQPDFSSKLPRDHFHERNDFISGQQRFDSEDTKFSTSENTFERRMQNEPGMSYTNQMKFTSSNEPLFIGNNMGNLRLDKRGEEANQGMNFPSRSHSDFAQENWQDRRYEETRNFPPNQTGNFSLQEHHGMITENRGNFRLDDRRDEMSQMVNFPARQDHESMRENRGNFWPTEKEEINKTSFPTEHHNLMQNKSRPDRRDEEINKIVKFPPLHDNLMQDERENFKQNRRDDFNKRNFLMQDERENFKQNRRDDDFNKRNFPPRHQYDSTREYESNFKPDKRDETNRFLSQQHQDSIRENMGSQRPNITHERSVLESEFCETSQVESSSIAEDNSRNPVKFEVKMKLPVPTSKIVDEAFDREAKESEIKKKLSRLSPEKAAEKMNKNKANSSVKPVKEEKGVKSEEKTSLEGSQSRSHRKLSDDKFKTNNTQSPKRDNDNFKTTSSSEKKSDRTVENDRSKDKSSSSSKDNGRSNYDHQRTSERKARDDDYHQRSSTRSRSNYRSESSRSTSSSRAHIKEERKETSESGSCMVQLINVHPDIGLEEILDFFRTFDLRKDKIVRRYTDRGEATGDVRVCFKNSHDSEKAVKTLNRHYLGGIPVEMFLV